ncbi:MAG: hypothetical protein V1727_00435 [Candidatus Omnitrophota bacterium]
MYNAVCLIASVAQGKGASAYLVGGFVRDLIMGKKNLDVDIMIEGNALELISELKRRLQASSRIYQRFGTATITLPEGFKIDLASARKEYYAHPAALPQIFLSTIEDDLGRRDFTINTMAIKLQKEHFGTLLDAFGGLADLVNGKIRVLHQNSFIDDPTRILRAIRFAVRFNFSLDKNTERLLKEAIKKKMLQRLSAFRLGGELIWLLKEDQPLKYLLELSRFRGLSCIHRQLRLIPASHHFFTTAGEVLSWFKKVRPQLYFEQWLVYFMLLTQALSLAQLKTLCQSFSFTKGQTEKIISFKANASNIFSILAKKSQLSRSTIYSILRHFSYEELITFLALCKDKVRARRIRLYITTLSMVQLCVSGKYLQKLSLVPGPEYARILEKTLLAKIDCKIRTKAQELVFVKQCIQQPKQ